MAYESWLHPTPISGTGSGTISNTVAQHTGRVNRNTIVTVTPTTGTAKTYSVTQTAADEFLTTSDLINVTADSTSQVISGVSNSAKITWISGSTGTLAITAPTTYIADSLTATSGTNIPGDPGAKASFNFNGTITFTANTTIDSRTGTFTITGGAGGSGLIKTVTITQMAAAATLTITPTNGTFNAVDGERSNNVAVVSNATWTTSVGSDSWLNVEPSGGVGNYNTIVSANRYYGRNSRVGTVAYYIVGNEQTTSKTYTATQDGLGESLSWDSSTYIATKAGGVVNMYGRGNVSSITFSLKTGNTVTPIIPTTYTVTTSSGPQITVNNGAIIPGDPGASAEYTFVIGITLPANLTIDSKSCTIVATSTDGKVEESEITQSAGDVSLDVSPTTLTFQAIASSPQTVNVISNTSWTVS